MKTELCLMVKLPEVHCDASSAGPDLHVFYSDGKSEQTWTNSAGFLKPAFWVNTWRSGLTDLQLQCLYTQTGLENPHLKQIWILHCNSGVLLVDRPTQLTCISDIYQKTNTKDKAFCYYCSTVKLSGNVTVWYFTGGNSSCRLTIWYCSKFKLSGNVPIWYSQTVRQCNCLVLYGWKCIFQANYLVLPSPLTQIAALNSPLHFPTRCKYW